MPRRIGRRREPGTGSRLEREMISFGATGALALATLFSAELDDVFLRAKELEGLERRADHVEGVRRAEALGEDVLDAGGLEDRAHAAAGDDAGAGGRGLHPDLGGAELRDDLVRDRPFGDDREADEGLAGVRVALQDGGLDVLGLAHAVADLAGGVADDDERGEREALAALDDLGHAVDRDDGLLESALFAGIVAARAAARAAAIAALSAAIAALGPFGRRGNDGLGGNRRRRLS